MINFSTKDFALKFKFQRFGISLFAKLVGAHRIFPKGQIRVHAGATIDCRRDPFLGNDDCGESAVHIGTSTTICSGALILPYGGEIRIGDNCSVNPLTILYGHGGLSIGNNTRIACHTVIIPAQHQFSSAGIAICEQGLSRQGIQIGEDVWIGANVTILDGAIIGNGCVVAAGAVVNRSFPAGVVIGGVPARELKSRSIL